MTDQRVITEVDSEILTRLQDRVYDFLDLGCSEGGSIDYCMRRFGARRGLGVDIQAAKVAKVRGKGFEAVQADILKFKCPTGSVRFVSMMDFLEHLPDEAVVERVLRCARGFARDFLFIRHPSFDDEAYLAAKGLKLYWTDWPRGHTAKLTVPDFTALFHRLGLNQYAIFFRRPIHDSNHPSVLPLSAPPNQHDYNPELHGPKPRVVFPKPVYSQIDFLVALRPSDAKEWNQLCAKSACL